MEQTENTAVKWLGGLSVIIGLWLVIAPFSLGIASTSTYWNAIIVGAIAVVLGAYQYSRPTLSWPSWVSFLAGVWLIISPYIFNPGEAAAFTNAVISGLALGLVSLFGAIAAGAAVIESSDQHHHVPMR